MASIQNSILLSMTIGAASPALSLDVFTTGSVVKKAFSISLTENAGDVVSFKTRDTNFPEREKVEYSGITTDFIAKKLKLTPATVLTFMCKDDYIMAETVAELSKTGAMIAFKDQNGEIHQRFGGPITMVHKTETSIELYPWYISGVFAGEISKPSLSIETDGKIKELSWGAVSAASGLETLTIALPSPRGRRPAAAGEPSKTGKFGFRPLSDFIAASGAPKVTVSFSLADGTKVTRSYSASDWPKIKLAVLKNGKEIPIYDGGPFIVTHAEKPTEKPLFYVTNISAQVKK